MNFVRKFRLEMVLFLIIAACYFWLRTLHLMILPIFTDEAIYTRWAQIALNDASWRFISLTDGKQPLFVWFAMVFMKFISDPLLAARSVSIFSGFFTLLGLWFLSLELFKDKKVAFLTSILYIFYPFAQVYDRMALMDSMVATFSIWALYFSILLVRKVRLDLAYTLGFFIGGGILTKSSNFFSIYCLPFTVLLFDFKKLNRAQRFLKWVSFVVIAVLISQLIYGVLRLSPLYMMINTKNAVFVYPFSEWITHPFTFFVGNLHGLFDWLTNYLKIPYILLIIVSLLSLKNYKQKFLLFLYFFMPLVALALFGKVIFPRFIFFMSLYLLPIAASGLALIADFIASKVKIKPLLSYIVITLFFIVYPGYASYQFSLDPVGSNIPLSDRNQYVDSWSAGWGVKESVDFLRQQSQNQKIFVATEGTFGLMPASLELYLNKDKNVSIKGFWPVGDNLPKETLDSAKKMPTYFIFYQEPHQIIPPQFPLKLIFEKQMGNSSFYYRLYQVIPKKEL